jgi:penicillin amidase
MNGNAIGPCPKNVFMIKSFWERRFPLMARKKMNYRVTACLLLFIGATSSQGLGAAEAKEVLAVEGLRQPVEIIKDRWGISHIYAQNQEDLFFAQGFNVASDRLFQLELWRRQATGTLAEILGRRALRRDIGARLLRFRGDIQTELNFYHPRGEEIVSSFVRGINAYIDLTRKKPELLPLEFRLLSIRPGLWTPEVVISRHNGLFRNVSDEVSLARAVHLMGPEKLGDLLDLHPGNPNLDPADGLDLGSIPGSILGLYREARSAVRFEPEDIAGHPVFSGRAAWLNFPQPTPTPFALPPPASPLSSLFSPLDSAWNLGSNNWAVSGRRTRSGLPLLANDPHRALQIPSLRYWVHLAAPGWNVIGGGEPALPGVSIGHNDFGAWGLTIFPADQEDLYVYDINPADPGRYIYGGSWEDMRVIREEIPVKDEQPYVATLKFTRHGPVLFEDPEKGKTYALRAAWLETGCAPYLSSLRLDQARTWPEFRAAVFDNRVPSLNIIWADRSGNIGWQATGLTPVRKNWPGLLPVPGDGRYEWSGFIPAGDLPSLFNPDSGFVATANQDNLPPGYPHQVGYIWADPFRFLRLSEVLSSGKKRTREDMAALQQDFLSIPARLLVSLARKLEPADPTLQRALRMLREWDFVLAPDSAAAAVYVAWQRAVLEHLNALMFPEELRETVPGRSLNKAIRRLQAPDSRFGSAPGEARNRLLLDSLGQAVAALRKMFGPDMARWRYGDTRFHHVLLRHPLSQTVTEDVRRLLDLGPLPRGGSAETINMTSGSNNQTSGATFRLIVDLADWDRTLGTNAPGQSGDPKNPHYSDLFSMWAGRRYFPVYFSRAKIQSAAEKTIILQPARRSDSCDSVTGR